MDALHLSTRRAGGTVTVTVAGEVDLATTDRLRGCVESVLARADGEPAAERVIREMSAVSFIDASELGALVAMHNLARGRARRCCWPGCPRRWSGCWR